MQNNLQLNWCECKLGDVFKTSSGGTPSRKETSYYGGDIPWLKSGELNDGIISEAEEFITKEGLENSSAKIFPKGSILLALYGATVGKIGILDFDSATNQAVCCIYSNPYFDKNLLFYYLLSQRKHLINQGKGGAQPNISQDIVKNLVLPLPPLAEQERIVDKIEALFSDIDEGVERLKSAQAQIKQYRQSVLKSAFEGKLYKTTEWKEVQLGDAITKLCNGTSKKQNKNATGIPVTRIETISDSTINFNRVGYISDFSQEDIDAYKLVDGDILFSNINSDFHLGKTAIYYGNKLLLHGMNLLLIRLNKENVFPSFINNYLNYCRFAGKFIKIAQHAVNQSSINQSKLRSFPIPLPTLPEQQRIVEEIEKRFAVADVLEKAVNEGLEKADKLKQSILKKAFEGKLVAQNPNDEPASVLLERIKKEQKPTKGKKKC